MKVDPRNVDWKQTKYRKGRRNAEKRIGARKIIQGVAWLKHPVVYWSGTLPKMSYAEPVAYRPILKIIGERLRNEPRGIYAVQIESDPTVPADAEAIENVAARTNPSVVDVIPVNRNLIAKTSQVLVASKRYPKALPKLIGDVTAWRKEIEPRFQRVSMAVKVLATIEKSADAGLTVEEVCLWIGPDEDRPSRRVETAVMTSWLQRSPEESAGKRLAAVVLGQRNVSCRLPTPLVKWMRAGAALSRWSPDWVCQFQEKWSKNSPIPRNLALNAPEIALAAVEFLIAMPEKGIGDLPMVLDGISFTIVKPLQTASTDWRMTVSGLTGRLTAISQNSRSRLIKYLASWFDHCRQWCSQGEGDDAIQLAVASVEIGVGFAGGLPYGWEDEPHAKRNRLRLMEILAQYGHDLFNWVVHQEETRSAPRLPMTCQTALEWLAGVPLSVLGRLGALTLDGCRQIIQRDQFELIHPMLSKNPEAIAPFMEWLATCDPDWFQLSAYDRSQWTHLFSISKRLRSLLTEWLASVVARPNRTWEDATSFLEDVLVGFSYGWLTKDVLIEGTEIDDSSSKARQEFLVRYFFLVEKILDDAEGYLDTLRHEGSAFDVHLAFRHRIPILEIGYQHHQAGYEDLDHLVAQLLEHCTDRDNAQIAADEEYYPADYFPMLEEEDDSCLAVLMAAGKGSRLRKLLAIQMTGYRYPEHPLAGWRFLSRHQRVQEFLSGCLDRPELTPPRRVLKLLQRLALAVRLHCHHSVQIGLAQWEKPVSMRVNPLPETFLPHSLSSAVAAELNQLLAYRAMANKTGTFPKAMTRIIERPQALEREYHALKQRENLSHAQTRRLEHLRQTLADPEGLKAWMDRDLAAAIHKQMQLTKLEALENIVGSAIRAHSQQIIGVGHTGAKIDVARPDWDNALRLYQTTTRNKRILKKFLYHAARDRSELQWIRSHPKNVEFIEKMQAIGVDMDVWLDRSEHRVTVDGDTWTAYTESDPLKVLQMGNLFGTCLSVDNKNAFATIANAVEVNKRVLYIQNGKGQVIGRKLIVLSRDGVLLGFRSYGNATVEEPGGSPWVKIAFDLLCLSLVKRSGIRFPTAADESRSNTDEGRSDAGEAAHELFAKGYDDGTEPFDWWVKGGAYGEDLAPKALVPAINRRLWQVTNPRDEDEDEMTLRALIWMGNEARPILHDLMNAVGRRVVDGIKFVDKHTQSLTVRDDIKQWMES